LRNGGYVLADNKKLEEFLSLVDRHDFFDKLYDNLRLIDPKEKKVIYCLDDKFIEEEGSCYEFWGESKMCNDCVSMRAFKNEDTFVKIKYTKSSVYLVTALPLQIKKRKLILEMIKDITNTITIEGQIKEKSRTQMKNIAENLQSMVVRDSLTDLFNRRYIDMTLPKSLRKAKEKGTEITVIMTDIDNFKEVNDNYGHTVGDEVIRSFADIISKSIRKDFDWAARYGGEEFLICLPDSDGDKARIVAERIRKTLSEYEFDSDGIKFCVTASFGLCTVGANSDKEYLEVINCADNRLLDAKNDGKDKVN
jgi:diguanylate cyclase (GGDEF)-like protein